MVALALGDEDAMTSLRDETTCANEPSPRPEPRPRRASEPDLPAERYQLGEPIGRGGMGEVVAAYDIQIGREVAIKRLHATRASSVALSRFMREARIQGRLEHPAIPPVYELAHDDEEQPFFAMKKLAGVTLAQVLRDPATRVQFSQQRLLRAFVEVCHAADFAHTRGVIHRDLKPSNVLLGEFGEVYVLDWGIALVLDEIDAPVDTPRRSPVRVVVGTPGYMAPEQIVSTRVDRRADVYALGCLLYEILAGRRLHPRGEAGMRSVLAGVDARPSLVCDDVAPELDELCVRATAVELDARIASARELGDAVQRYLDGDRDLARRHELARAHLATARAALAGAADEPTQRSTAMREAGRALALDPTLTPAAEIVSRLMLEPPAQTPSAVAAELDDIDAAEHRRQGRLAAWVHVGYFALAPLFWLFGIRDVAYLGAFAAAALLNVWFQLAAARNGRPALTLGGIVTDVAIIALLARMFTPFFIAPGVAAVTLMVCALNPDVVSKRRTIAMCAVLGLASVLGVWLAELLGIVSPTMQIEGGVIMLRSPLAGFETFPTVPALVLYTLVLIAVAGSMAFAGARVGRDQRRRLHVQAWQLRQLVSPSAE